VTRARFGRALPKASGNGNEKREQNVAKLKIVARVFATHRAVFALNACGFGVLMSQHKILSVVGGVGALQKGKGMTLSLG
jgi:hypothetical protein